MVKDKVNDISKTGANLLLGGDCGCLLNISGAMKHSGNKNSSSTYCGIYLGTYH